MTVQESNQYATFSVAGHNLAIHVLDVQEVLRNQDLRRVPLAPDAVDGLINVRGQIVPAVDMRTVLQLPRRQPDITPASVVVRTEHGAVSLQVDEIGDVIELDASSFEAPPRNVEPGLRRLLRGVHKLKTGLLLVIDIQKATDLNAN